MSTRAEKFDAAMAQARAMIDEAMAQTEEQMAKVRAVIDEMKLSPASKRLDALMKESAERWAITKEAMQHGLRKQNAAMAQLKKELGW